MKPDDEHHSIRSTVTGVSSNSAKTLLHVKAAADSSCKTVNLSPHALNHFKGRGIVS
jgi:hypothetical protein